MFDWLLQLLGIKKTRRQLCLIFTEDLRIVPQQMKVEKEYVYDEKTGETWHLIHKLLFPMPNGKYALLLNERESLPRDPYKALKDKQRRNLVDSDTIAVRHHDEALGQVAKKPEKGWMAKMYMLAVIGALIVFGITAIAVLTGRFPTLVG